MRYQLYTEPTIEPVTDADLVAHCQLGELPDDQVGTARAILVAARQWVENRLCRQLITATWKLHLDDFPDEILIADKLPIATIMSVQYYDENKTQQTLSASAYQTDLTSKNRPARIKPAYNYTWPTLYPDLYNVVTVTFTAGYGSTRESVPLGIRHAILLLAGAWWENRENEVVGTITSPLKTGVELCLQPFDWGAYS